MEFEWACSDLSTTAENHMEFSEGMTTDKSSQSELKLLSASLTLWCPLAAGDGSPLTFPSLSGLASAMCVVTS